MSGHWELLVHTQRVQPSMQPSATDLEVLDLVRSALNEYGEDIVHVSHNWGSAAGMWFVEVRPANTRAARIDIAFDGDDLINITVGETWFEMFPFADGTLDGIRTIVAAVAAGGFEEVRGSLFGEGRGRLYTETGTWRVGALGLPLPWRLPPRRRYEP